MLNVTFSINLTSGFEQSSAAESGMHEQGIYHKTVSEAVQFLRDWYIESISDITMDNGRATVLFNDESKMTISA